MSYTVVGLFPDYAQTQRAVERLQALGISSKHIDVARSRQDGPESVKDEPERKQGWVGTDKVSDNNLSRFFKSLFSDRDAEVSDRYSRVASSGHAVVTVLTASQEEAERAADILDAYGAINVDEQAGGGTQGTMRNVGGMPAQGSIEVRERTASGMSYGREQESHSETSDHRRVHSQIVNRSIDENLRLRDESRNQHEDTDWGWNRPGSSGF